MHQNKFKMCGKVAESVSAYFAIQNFSGSLENDWKTEN